MKTKILLRIALALLFVILFIPQRAAAEDTLNPCWTMIIKDDPQHGSFNPDSIMVDTCLCPPGTYYCKFIYAKKYYRIRISYNSLIIPQAPRDSIIYRHWEDIDTSFINLRKKLDTLEIIFGNYVLQKKNIQI